MRVYYIQRLILILIACISIYHLSSQRRLCQMERDGFGFIPKDYVAKKSLNEDIIKVVNDQNQTDDQALNYSDSNIPHRRRKRIAAEEQKVKDLPVDEEYQNYPKHLKDEGKNLTGNEFNANTTSQFGEPVEIILTASFDEHDNSSSIQKKMETAYSPSRIAFFVMSGVHTRQCVNLHTKDIFGYGNDQMHMVMRPFILPIVFLFMGITFAIVNMSQIYNSFIDLTQVQSGINCLVHIVFWATSAVSLFLHRYSWPSTWANSNISPEYPAEWLMIEIICFIVLVLLILEVFAYDLSFYNIYIEKSGGVYRVIEPSAYKCSIYHHNGLEQTA